MPKKILVFTYTLILLYSYTLTLSHAQEATPSAVISDQVEQTLFSNLPETISNSAPSAQIRIPPVVRPLKKGSFRANEKISVVIGNAASSNIKIKVFNVDGQETPVDIETVNPANPTVLTLRPPSQFKAGRYRLEITDPEGNITTQDFTWGVLAINTNKSVYLPNETTKLSMAVLDETGLMICDANVTLNIKAPVGQTATLSTSDKTIIINPECSIKDFTLKPDYEASYQVADPGTYAMNLTAVTSNGTYSISDSFEVRDSVDFDIERVSATRLFPPETYPVVLDITFNTDFTGTISETVPAIFAITPNTGTTPYDILDLATPSATIISNVPQLGLPFDNTYPLSQGFGTQPDDPILTEKYIKYGVIGHDGVDFALPDGTGVLAVDDGEVVAADVNGTYGQTVVIQHAWGKSYYGHMSLITARVGQKRAKGLPIGLSGHSGLATGPHLHFGIKPTDNDVNNGYYGKINPLPYLGLIQQENGVAYTTGIPSDTAVTTLTWNISTKAGDKLKLGYAFKAPNISPQFYLLGPLQFRNTSGQLLFEETRRWQLAVDANGVGTNTVNPTYGVISTTQNIYTFTFTATSTMDSGGITITVPADWSSPDATVGSDGYTTASTTNNATIANVLQNADAEDPADGIWNEFDIDTCGASGSTAATDIVVDTTNKQEGTGSIQCASAGTASDGDDAWGYIYDADQNWATACNGGACTEVGYWIRPAVTGTGDRAEFAWSNTTDLFGGRIAGCSINGLTNATWSYKKCTLSGTLTTIRSFGLICTHATCSPMNDGVVNIDEVLIGPGVPTFSGSGSWDISVRLLDMAAGEKLNVIYGAGGGTSGVTNSSTIGTHTFTTKSRELVTDSLGNIANHPFVTLIGSNTDLLRHGKWFDNNGARQPFLF